MKTSIHLRTNGYLGYKCSYGHLGYQCSFGFSTHLCYNGYLGCQGCLSSLVVTVTRTRQKFPVFLDNTKRDS